MFPVKGIQIGTIASSIARCTGDSWTINLRILADRLLNKRRVNSEGRPDEIGRGSWQFNNSVSSPLALACLALPPQAAAVWEEGWDTNGNTFLT